MKKLTLILSMMMTVAIAANAQTEKGKVVVSGSSDLNFSNATRTYEYDGEELSDQDISNFNIAPSIGYFIADGLALGLTLDIETNKVDDSTTNSVTFGPTLQYYFGNSDIKPFIGAGVYFGSQTEKQDTDKATGKVNGWDIGAGVAFFINDFASIDAGLGYASATATSNDDDKAKIKANGIGLKIGFSLYF